MIPAALFVVAVVFFVYVTRTLQQYLALKEFKGPAIAGFSRLWLLRANGSGKMNTIFTEVNDKYGQSSECSLYRTMPLAFHTYAPNILDKCTFAMTLAQDAALEAVLND